MRASRVKTIDDHTPEYEDEPIPYPEPTSLEEQIANASAAMNNLGRRIDRDNVSRDRLIASNAFTIQRMKIGVSVMALLLIAVIIGALYAYNSASKANDAADRANSALSQLQTERQAQKVGSCLSAQKDRRDVIAWAEEHDAVWADLLVPPPRTPEEQQAVDDGLASLHNQVTHALRVRDCDPAAIEDYLAGEGGFLPPNG